jgi:hydrogenase expression/formation protein HypC
MCLAIPAQITELKENNAATVNVGGVYKEISLALLPEKVIVGDFVIMHVGFALSKLDKEVAKKTLADFQEMLKDEG